MVLCICNDVLLAYRFFTTCTNAQILDIKILEDYFVYSSQLKSRLDIKANLNHIQQNSVFIITNEPVYMFAEREYERCKYLMGKVARQFPNFKVIYITTDSMLQQYLNALKIKTATNIDVVKFIAYVKKQKAVDQKIKNLLTEAGVNHIIINNFGSADTKKDAFKIMMFTKLKVSFDKNIKAPLLQHALIKNWEQFFNQLSKTDLYKYLK